MSQGVVTFVHWYNASSAQKHNTLWHSIDLCCFISMTFACVLNCVFTLINVKQPFYYPNVTMKIYSIGI